VLEIYRSIREDVQSCDSGIVRHVDCTTRMYWSVCLSVHYYTLTVGVCGGYVGVLAGALQDGLHVRFIACY